MRRDRRLSVAVIGDARAIQDALVGHHIVSLADVLRGGVVDCVVLSDFGPDDLVRARSLAAGGTPDAVVLGSAGSTDIRRFGFRNVRETQASSLAAILGDIAASGDAEPLRALVRAVEGHLIEVSCVSGVLQKGDTVCEAREGLGALVEDVEDVDGDLVRLTLDRSLAVSPGDVICRLTERPEVADQFAARIVWQGGVPLIAGRAYRLKVGEKIVTGSVTTIKHRIEPGIAEPLAARTLRDGETGAVNLSLRSPIAFDLTDRSGRLRRVRVYDTSEETLLGTGVLDFALRRAANIHWQSVAVSKSQRAALKHQKPVLVWFTGLSGSGKSTVANLLEARLISEGCHTYLLDGDNVRHGLNRDLGFTDADRVENIRRVAEIAKLMVDAGLIVLASFISPFRAERALARDLLGEGEFVEVFVDAPLAVAEERDPKGLYRRARRGELRNFTGIDSPYEAPDRPDIRLDTASTPAETLAEQVFALLAERGHLVA
ncbi:adenylyl-sulfate kinase [Aureimonas sp. AU4]|uniref:adenylyl-sulfate kinase n=1 Tax=Aureimonas sp. AU4 TaxID=1638163 RepID=UPI0007857207|nr:adenylyl-sulfate kinase [Aureimonas sp. AU4]